MLWYSTLLLNHYRPLANMFGVPLAFVSCVLIAGYASAQSVSSNCLLNDVQLSAFIEDVISKASVDTYDDPSKWPIYRLYSGSYIVLFLTMLLSTVVSLLRITYESDTLSVYLTDSSTLATQLLSSVPVGDTQSISEDNIIAYIPSFIDDDGNVLGTGFLNLEAIYPCMSQGSSDMPRCSRQTMGEEGFNKGNAVVDTADRGQKFQIFGIGISTYAFAVSTCPDFTPPSDGCLRDGYTFAIACYLPRFWCPMP